VTLLYPGGADVVVLLEAPGAAGRRRRSTVAIDRNGSRAVLGACLDADPGRHILEVFEPWGGAERLEDLTRFVQERLRLHHNTLLDEPSAVLQERHRSHERHRELAEGRGGRGEAGLDALELPATGRQARPEPRSLRPHVRRKLSGTHRLDLREELLDLREVPEVEGRLERLGQGLLHGLGADAGR